MMYDRSGTRLGTFRLGRMFFIRQEMLRPGDRYSVSLGGRVRLGALREQEAIPMHCHIELFVTPVRWLWDGYVNFVTADYSAGAAHPPTLDWATIIGHTRDDSTSPDFLGIGDFNNDQIEFYRMYWDNYFRVYNEYFKWPEDADAGISTLRNVSFGEYGLRAVQMEAFDTRFRRDISEDNEDRTVPASTTVSLTGLVRTSAQLRLDQTQEWLTSGRYRETMREYFGGAGSHEVDQVPISYGGPAGWLTAENIWATDGGSLGRISAIHEFDINHDWGRVAVPEHSILSLAMVVRPQRLLEGAINPHAGAHGRSRADWLGLDQILQVTEPKDWHAFDFYNHQANNTNSYFGRAPAGHEWRTGWDMVDRDITDRAFTTSRLDPSTHPYCPDYAGFVSQSLGQGLFRVDCGLKVDSDIHNPMASVMTGAGL